jgi:hypothetical protein
MSDDLTKLTMVELLDRYAQFCEMSGSLSLRRSVAIGHASGTRAEINRRLAEALEVGGSEVRYALEGAS